MTDLTHALADYLTLRRALGYKLERPGLLLAQFIQFVEASGADTITVEHALAWAKSPNGGATWWAMRMSAVRGFTAYLHNIDPSLAQVMPSDLLPSRPERAIPFLYSDEQIAALLDAAQRSSSPLRVATYQTLIGLIAVTGMRLGEAIRLDRSDVDLTRELLLIRNTKFGKTREIPLHPSTGEALRSYLRRPDRRSLPSESPAVFVSTAGTRVEISGVQRTFRELVRRAGITPLSARCRPRIHDLRHTFAVRTVMDAYDDGGDVDHRLSLLSTYLGHAHPRYTYWYLTAAPELMTLAAQRLENHFTKEQS